MLSDQSSQGAPSKSSLSCLPKSHQRIFGAILYVDLVIYIILGPDLQNILRQSYDYLYTVMPKLRSTYDGRLIYKTSYEGRKAFLRNDSLAKL